MIPEKDKYAIEIRPVKIMVIPRPFSPSGIFEYLSLNLIDAIVTIAKAKPAPELNPNTMDSPKLYARSCINSDAPRIAQLTAIKGQTLTGDVLQFAITPKDRKTLHQRIELRFNQMIEQGFQEEVVKLRERGDLHENLPSIRCVGYRQMWQHLNGDYDFDEMIFKGVCATRQLAKRQLTWLRGWENLTWLEMENSTNLQVITSQISKL